MSVQKELADRKIRWKMIFIRYFELRLTKTWHGFYLHNKEIWALCLAYNIMTDDKFFIDHLKCITQTLLTKIYEKYD